MTFCEISGVCGEFVSDDAFFYVLFVGQAEVLFGRDVAEHCSAEPADHRGTDAARDVVVAGSYVGRQRP